MHFHLPQPLHGWREFLGEVAIIVLGVLIALGAEQMVENWHWREQVRDGREALREDFVVILINASEREAEDKCIRGRLAYLRTLLDGHSGNLPALGHVGSPPARPWYPASWDSLVASDVSAHMNRPDLLGFGYLAQQARRAEDAANREIEDWAVIYTMVGPARRLANGEEAQIRKATTDAAFQLNQLRLLAPQIRAQIIASGLLTKRNIADAHAGTLQLLAGPNARHICGPVLRAGADGVDAPYDPAVEPNPQNPNGT